LRAVGYKGPDVFNKKTAGVVKKYSDGLTRRINILADKSMLAAFSEGSHTVTATHVKSAAQDSEFKKTVDSKKILLSTLAVLLLAGVLFAGIYIGRQDSAEQNLIKTATKPAVTQEASLTQSPAPRIDSTTVPVETVNNVTFENVSERLAKTQQWLSVAADNNFSIQLFMARTSDADKVEAFLRNAPETLDFTKIYIYETDVNGRSWYSVLYNEFITQDEAIEKLDTLPASLKASDPYLRRISALKKDVAR
jgi:septal ring-binding cell division protein DamX